MDPLTMLMIFCMAMLTPSRNIIGAVNVVDYGAVGDGKTDSSQAFMKAWNAVCGANVNSTSIEVLEGQNFLLKPVTFKGPCKAPNIAFQINGTITAPSDPSDWNGSNQENWIMFNGVNGVNVSGGGKGLIDGQGANWWKECGDNHCERPTAIRIDFCNNFQFSGLKLINSQAAFIKVYGSDGVIISNIHIAAPHDTHNTDGIDISHTTNVHIFDSIIGTGDDCVAIITSSSNINVTGVTCGPGHGISIGSLGQNGSYDTVEEVHVKDCIFNGSTSGARIKTWQGGRGYVRNVSYDNITLIDVGTPILIDQFYCPDNNVCNNQTNAVNIRGVSYTRFNGTAMNGEAITLNCSQSVGCTDILLGYINITSADPMTKAVAACNNAHGKFRNAIPSVGCLLS